jgi:glycosidase
VLLVVQGYLPRDLYCLDSKYGSEADLRNLISVFHEHGIKVIADVVVNHRCANFQVGVHLWAGGECQGGSVYLWEQCGRGWWM